MDTPVPGILLRRANNDHYIGNVPIEKGLLIGNSAIPNQHNPKYFKDPKVFRPERW